MKDYQVNAGEIISDKGLPWAPRWFCDGRLAVQVDDDGIGQIDHFAAGSKGSYIVCRRRFWGGMRFFAVQDGARRQIVPRRCRIWPYGYSAETDCGEFSLFVADGCILFRFQPRGCRALEIQFYEEFLFVPDNSDTPDIRLRGLPRKWMCPESDGRTVRVAYQEEGYDGCLTFAANRPLTLRQTEKNRKYTLSSEPTNEAVTVCLSLTGKVIDYDAAVDAQCKRYRAVAERAPVLHSGRPLLDQFFALAPLYHESLKATDVPGAIRAQSSHYWVWGWDSMTSGDACFYWGDLTFIEQMLDCFMQYADENGIAHAFDRDMRCEGSAPAPAQGMYLTLLDRYRMAGGNVSPYYPFAVRLFDRIVETEVGRTGLCSGTSLYPDFRELIGENGRDISTFNNTVSYCAIRAMARIARAVGDDRTMDAAEAFGDRLQKNFDSVLYNEQAGFFDSSAEIGSGVQRGVLSNNAVKWESDDCRDLVWPRAEECLRFYERELVSPAGLRPLPESSGAYDADANQLHCWWAVMSEFYIRLINGLDRPQLIRQYCGWLEYWSERLMIPEGIDCYSGRADVPFDHWNAMSGIWQGYNIRGFYNAIVHGVVGVGFDGDGMRLYPYSGEEMRLDNLHFGARTFSVRMCGSGPRIRSVTLNGEPLGAVDTIPYGRMRENNAVTVVRGPAEE